MALITCPECNREISDTALSCPHCGYVMNPVSTAQTRRTPLSAVEPTFMTGVLMIVGGIICGLGSLVFLLFFLPLGIFGLIISLLILVSGFPMLPGVQKGACPYCGNEVTVSANCVTYKCPHCHKTSTKSEDSLETID